MTGSFAPRAVIRASSLLVPSMRRSEWLAEWHSELLYVPQGDALSFAMGSLADAFWIARNHVREWPAISSLLRSRFICLPLLSALALLSLLLGARFQAELPPSATRGGPGSPGLLGLIATYIVLAVGSLLFGGPIHMRATLWFRTPRMWLFLAVKIACLLPVFRCALLMITVVDSPPVTLLLLAGNFALFRWSFSDQERRCPSCLRRLINPVRVGCASATFLDWYGSEFMCARGHGFLQTPEIGASQCERQWLKLDDSWSSLFSKRIGTRT